jgi:hypothetical protein
MKKRLLLGAFIFGSVFSAMAQGSDCASAEVLTGNGTRTINGVAGTYFAGCYGSTLNDAGDAMLGSWYAYTPSASGYLTLSSDLESNEEELDTRLSVFTGICAELTCYNASDDVQNSYRTTLRIPVAAGVTYYIQWDNYWQTEEFSDSFDFTFNFEGASCLSPNLVTGLNTTTTSASITFDASVTPVSSYDIAYGEPDFEPGTEEGTIVNGTSTTVLLSNLSPAGSTFDFYVRSNCGDTYGEWTGPYGFTLPVSLPYSNNFDDADDAADGFSTVGGWNLSTDTEQQAPVGTLSQSPEGFLFSNVSATAASDGYIFTRAISLAANESVTVKLYAWYISSSEATLDVTVGSTTDPDDHEVISTFEIAGSNTGYEEFTTAVWTPSSAGVYYFGLHNASVAARSSTLLVDTLAITSVLGADKFTKTNFSAFPNPTSAIINVTNASALISAIQVTDLNGRIVKSSSFNGVNNAEINISDLASGVYMMNISSDKGTVTKKIVKN